MLGEVLDALYLEPPGTDAPEGSAEILQFRLARDSDLQHRAIKDGSESPNRDVATQLSQQIGGKVTAAMVRDWMKGSRKRGLATPPGQARIGGTLLRREGRARAVVTWESLTWASRCPSEVPVPGADNRRYRTHQPISAVGPRLSRSCDDSGWPLPST